MCRGWPAFFTKQWKLTLTLKTNSRSIFPISFCAPGRCSNRPGRIRPPSGTEKRVRGRFPRPGASLAGRFGTPAQ